MQIWERAKLRRTAIRFAAHGWHVVPGAYLVGGRTGRHAKERRFECGDLGCPTITCHPIVTGWTNLASTDPDRVANWWRERPYSVLLATGHAFDVLEVPAGLGRAAVLGDGHVAATGPVAVTPSGRWMFMVQPGHGVLPELSRHQDVLLHGIGSWVPAAPSPHFGGRVRWEIGPERNGWRLAEPYVIQNLMLDAIGAAAKALHRPGWRPVTWAA